MTLSSLVYIIKPLYKPGKCKTKILKLNFYFLYLKDPCNNSTGSYKVVDIIQGKLFNVNQ